MRQRQLHVRCLRSDPGRFRSRSTRLARADRIAWGLRAQRRRRGPIRGGGGAPIAAPPPRLNPAAARPAAPSAMLAAIGW
jgi:hypothetical protein